MIEFHNYGAAPYALGTGAGTTRPAVVAIPKKAWFDFSDLSSLYIDDAGVGGNVSADAETVGLALDKAQMGGKSAGALIVAQPELATNGGFDTGDLTGWSTYDTGDGDTSYDNGEALLVGTAAGRATLEQGIPTTVGRYYRVNVDLTKVSGALLFVSVQTGPASSGSIVLDIGAQSVSTSISVFFKAESATSYFRTITQSGNAATWRVDNLSVKEVPGLHFSQADAGKEPEFTKLLKANVDLSEQSELVTNGTFDTDLTGWTLSANTPPTWVAGGYMQLNSDGVTFSDADQQIATETGKFYRIQLDLHANANGTQLFAGTTQGASNLLNVLTSSLNAVGTHTFTFRATGSVTWLRLRDGSPTANQQFDNVSVKEVPASQLFNALRTYGVDELLIGEPVMYDQGGMVMVFGVQAEAQSNAALYFEGNASDTSPKYVIGTGFSDTAKLRLLLQNDAGGTALNIESTVDVFDGSPHVVVVVDSGDGYEIRVDGAPAGSGSYTRAGTLTLDTAALFSRKTTSESNHFDGHLVGPIVADPAVVSETQIGSMQALLAQEMGVTLA